MCLLCAVSSNCSGSSFSFCLRFVPGEPLNVWFCPVPRVPAQGMTARSPVKSLGTLLLGERCCSNARSLPPNLGKAEYRTIKMPLNAFCGSPCAWLRTDEWIGTLVEETVQHPHAASCPRTYRAASELF